MTQTGKSVLGQFAGLLGALGARLHSDSTAVWIGNFGSVGLRFALNVLIARLAGADQMGIYVAVLALTVIIGRLTDLGLPNSLVYFVRSHRSSTRRCVAVCVAHSAVMFPASIALLLSATSLGLVNADSASLIAKTWPALAALATIQLLGSLLSQILIPLNGFRSYGLTMTVSPIITIAGCLWFGADLDAGGIIIATLAGESCGALCGLALVLRAMPREAASGTAATLVGIYQYALKTYVGTSLKVLGQRGDRIILSWFLPNTLLAAYAVAVSLRDNASLPVTTHAMLLRNVLIDKEQRGAGPAGARAYLRRELLRWSLLTAGLAAALAASAPLLLPVLYGSQFKTAVGVLAILSGTLPAIAVASLCWTGLLAAGRPGFVSFGLILGGVVNLVALYFGTQIGAVIGASWGSLLASLVIAAWWLIATFGHSHKNQPVLKALS
jgi:O-antigen/teichoic acid export membrane protein